MKALEIKSIIQDVFTLLFFSIMFFVYGDSVAKIGLVYCLLVDFIDISIYVYGFEVKRWVVILMQVLDIIEILLLISLISGIL